jgi:chromosome segregation ATPase
MKEILLITIPSILAYILGWRLNNADLCGKRLDELEKSINVYNLIIDDLSKKVEELTGQIVRLEQTIESLKIENKQLKNKNSI